MSGAGYLGELLLVTKDGEWGKPEPSEDAVEMAVIRGTDFAAVRVGDVESVPVRYIPARIAARKSLQVNDIIIETAGGTKDQPTGRTLLLTDSILRRFSMPVTCASFSRFMRPDPSRVHPAFLFWQLQHLYEQRHLLKYHTQHTGVARFQFTTFSQREPLVLPHRSVQEKIAATLSAYDDLIENNTRRLAILEEMARSLYREWFVHFRFPGCQRWKDEEPQNEVLPQGWRIARLSDIAGVNSSSIKPTSAPDEICYVDISSVSTGRIDGVEKLKFASAPSRARRRVVHGDIIWSTVRPNRKSYSLIIEPEPNMIVSTGFAVISSKSVPFSYLYHALTTDDFVAYLTNHATGAAYPAVLAKDFENARIVIPPSPLLARFNEMVEPMILSRHVLLRRNEVLRRTRDLLLPKLISGELDVSALDITVPEDQA